MDPGIPERDKDHGASWAGRPLAATPGPRIGISGIGMSSMDAFQSPAPSSRWDRDGFPAGSLGISPAEPGPVSVTIPASPFMQKLGFGTGVSVYLMERSLQGLSLSPWAVKKINPGCSRHQRNLFQRRLCHEARTLRKLQHPNIVGYRALAEDPDGSLCLAMEFGGEKSLYGLIQERREHNLGAFPAATILHVALSVARGLQYLHMEQWLLHGDIKSPNVVVRGAFEAVKICDVGVSLPLDEDLTVSDPSVRYVGSEPWLPPEALELGGTISDRSDIFAFGLTLWEMLTLGVPHLIPPPGPTIDTWDSQLEDSMSEDSQSEDSWEQIAFHAVLGSRPALPQAAMVPAQAPVRELFCVCTAAQPRQRPPAAAIVRTLESHGESWESGDSVPRKTELREPRVMEPGDPGIMEP